MLNNLHVLHKQVGTVKS